MKIDGQRVSIIPRWALAALLTVAYLAIMVPLGFILNYASETHARSETQQTTICGMAVSIGHLAETLDDGLGLLIAEDDARADARNQLNTTIREGREQAQAAREKCDD